jgi:hypothetical protein
MEPSPKLEDVLTPEEIEHGKVVLKILGKSIKQIIERFLGDEQEFVVITRHKTELQSMLIMGESDGPGRMTEIIAEAYARHDNGSMNSFTNTPKTH